MSISTIGKITNTITVTVHPHDIRNVQITNADRIRSMTDEELAELLDDIAESAYSEGYSKETDEPYMSPYPPTKSAWGNWLKQEAADKEGDNGT